MAWKYMAEIQILKIASLAVYATKPPLEINF
jgi:hypothetical protein